MNLGFRGEIKIDVNVGIVSMYMVFRTMGLNLAA